MKRIDRVNSELQRQLAEILANEINDPRVNESLISIIKIETTEDLKYAKVFVSIMSEQFEKKEVLKALQNASGFMRNALKNKIDIRVLPSFKFVEDNSIEYGFKISSVLNSLKE